jgi:hypothetical protein
MKRLACVTILAGLLAAHGPAEAEPLEGNLTPTKPTSLQMLLLDEGYRAKMTVDDVGDPMITSATGGYDFDVIFYDCTDNTDCRSIQFSAAFTEPDHGTPEDLNTWNSNKRYARAYRNDSGDAVLRMDVSMDGEGMGKELFLENLALWGSLMADFVDSIWD